MKATEKQKIQAQLGKAISRFLNKYGEGLPYRDLIVMILNEARAVVRFCARYGSDECKTSSRKTEQLTDELIKSYAEMTKEERIRISAFEDDEPETEETNHGNHSE